MIGTIAGDILSRCAAWAKLPQAMTVVKVVMLVMRSMGVSRRAPETIARNRPVRSSAARDA